MSRKKQAPATTDVDQACSELSTITAELKVVSRQQLNTVTLRAFRDGAPLVSYAYKKLLEGFIKEEFELTPDEAFKLVIIGGAL